MKKGQAEGSRTFLAVYSPTSTGWSGYFPELPGAVVTAHTEDKLVDKLSEVLALHLSGMEEDHETIPTARLRSLSEVDDLEPDSRCALVVPASINPVSLAVARVIEDSGMSLRELERRTGIGYSVLSRLQDPFYWGHSLKSLVMFAEAFDLKPDFHFIAA